MSDYDERVVDLYDQDNPDGPDHDFYRALADEVHAGSILDLGCGTGLLTVTFTREGRSVVGMDPSAMMLAYACRRPGAGAVEWVHGDSGSIPGTGFDYAVMTGNVAQHIPDDHWARTLAGLHQALRKGGTLTFETRNPAVRAWESWGSGDRTTRVTRHGELMEWSEAFEVAPGLVELRPHNLFLESNETVTETLLLAFRDRSTLEKQLDDAGFDIEAIYGDWNKTALTEEASVMIFVARAR